MNTIQNVVLFGATSAIAQATSRLLAQQGCNLFLVGRNAMKLQALVDDLRVRAAPEQRIEGKTADLDLIDQHVHLFKAAETALGGMDTVIIAHGTLPDQAACEASVSLTLAQIHTNALSVIALASEAANRLQAQKHGMIVAIGSVAGDRGRQSNYVYGAAKGMLALFLQGLRNRLAPHGVRVLTVKPGFVDTPMTAAFEKKGPLWATPEDIARGIIKAMRSRRDVVYLPWFWYWIMLIIRLIPERIFKRMKL
jgi:short-subunit dehydrogenase